MQIVFCSNRYPPAHGGVEVYVRNIAEELSKTHSVRVVTIVQDERSLFDTLQDRANATVLTKDGAVVVNALRISRLRRIALHALRLEGLAQGLVEDSYYLIRSLCIRYTARLLSRELRQAVVGADIIHSMGPWELSHAVNLVRGNIPHVVTGFLHEGHWAHDIYSIKHFRACDHVVALTQAECSQYQELGIRPEKLTVVGVPSMTIAGRDVHAPVLENLPSRFVLFLGVKRDYKGLDLLLNSARIIWRTLPDVGFVFAGPRTEYSRKLFASMSSDHRIIEMDTVSEEEKIQLLQSCICLCW